MSRHMCCILEKQLMAEQPLYFGVESDAGFDARAGRGVEPGAADRSTTSSDNLWALQ